MKFRILRTFAVGVLAAACLVAMPGYVIADDSSAGVVARLKECVTENAEIEKNHSAPSVDGLIARCISQYNSWLQKVHPDMREKWIHHVRRDLDFLLK